MKPRRGTEAVIEEVHRFLKLHADYFKPGAGLKVLRKQTRDLAAIAYGPNPEPLDARLAGDGLVRAARAGDALSDEALRDWARKLGVQGKPFPPELAAYIDDALRDEWTRPHKSRDDLLPRNVALLWAIDLASTRANCSSTAALPLVIEALKRVDYYMDESSLASLRRNRKTGGRRPGQQRKKLKR